jgi:squalene-hopene/tetraprenyl-beta-curcumene cyclase
MNASRCPLPFSLITASLLLAASCVFPLLSQAGVEPPSKPPAAIPGMPLPATLHTPPATGPEAVQRGLEWLKAQQKPDGSWSDERYPALTALPLWCFAQSDFPGRDEIIKKAVAFIASCAQEDGGIYRNLAGRGGGLSTYNTAICLAALGTLNDPALTPLLLKARRFLAAAQYIGDDANSGGMGYDAKSERPYSDLNNTVWAVEAMRLTEKLEDLRPAGTAKADMNWEAVQKYLTRCQNTATSGPADQGGFSYRPDESKAGLQTNAQGVVVFRSYGTMTYAGILSMIYAKVDRSDARIKSALDWAARHWTLEENPGMGAEGQYYFYNILAKALAISGRSELPVPGKDKPIVWRQAMADKLLALQQPGPVKGQGFWINNAGRWQESDPVLVTSYVILGLQAAR